MPDSELALLELDSFSIPALITRAGPATRKKFIEFFKIPIRSTRLLDREQENNPSFLQ